MRPAAPEISTSPPTVKVWDGLVRCTHWLVAGLVLYLFFVSDGSSPEHRTAGTIVLATVGIRLVWGLVCHGHGRLASFWPGHRRALDYLRAARAGRLPRHLGHNPLGAWMIVGLWSLIALLGVTGWMMRMDVFWGDEWLQDLHTVIAYGLMAAAGLHIAGAITMGRLHRENLIAAMITGHKRPLEGPGAE